MIGENRINQIRAILPDGTYFYNQLSSADIIGQYEMILDQIFSR